MPIIVYRCPITQPVRRCGPEAAHTFKTAVLHNFPLHNPSEKLCNTAGHFLLVSFIFSSKGSENRN